MSTFCELVVKILIQQNNNACTVFNSNFNVIYRTSYICVIFRLFGVICVSVPQDVRVHEKRRHCQQFSMVTPFDSKSL